MAYSYRNRDPFARRTLIGREVPANGQTCAWCGNVRKGGKLIQFRMEPDAGHPYDFPQLFCSVADMKSYRS